MLTKRMQYQAIVDKLAGLPVRHTPADFEGRLKSLWEALEKAAPGREAQALYDVPGTPFERMELVDMIGSLKPGDDIGRLPTMSEVCRDMLPIEWLWPGWIPRGMITLLGAAPGSGKSLVALDLANRIIQGTSFPDGQPVPNPGNSILYVDAEVATRINHQRAKDWNIDMDRIFLKLPDENDGVIDLSNFAHRERLVEQVIRNKSELVIIDALSNMSSRGENDIEDVRSLMVFLNRLAQDSDAGLLVINGEMRPAEIVQLAHKEGFSRSLLYQVRNHLGNRILNSRPKDNPMNTWRLLD